MKADLLRSLGDYEGALVILAQLTQLDPNDSTIVLRQVELLERQERLPEALTLIESAIDNSSDPGELYIQAGELHYKLKQYDWALAKYQVALIVQPENGYAYRGIGMTQRKIGNNLAATEAFNHYLRIVPDAPDRGNIKGWLSKYKR